MDDAPQPTKVELGCGANKRPGFFGIDIADSPDVDLVLDIERQQLPFADDSVDYVYTSRAFEHLVNYQHVLREIRARLQAGCDGRDLGALRQVERGLPLRPHDVRPCVAVRVHR